MAQGKKVIAKAKTQKNKAKTVSSSKNLKKIVKKSAPKTVKKTVVKATKKPVPQKAKAKAVAVKKPVAKKSISDSIFKGSVVRKVIVPKKPVAPKVAAVKKPSAAQTKVANAQRIEELKRMVAAKAPSLSPAKKEVKKTKATASLPSSTPTIEAQKNQKATQMAQAAQQLAHQAVVKPGSVAASGTVSPTSYAPQRPANLVALVPIQVKKVPANDPAQKPQFKTGQLVVYPAHGVGKVEAIESQRIANQEVSVFKISFEQDRMTLKVPMYRVQSSGLRALSTTEKLDEALETMRGRPRIRRTMWSRRAQEYEAKINSGDPLAIAEVLRDLRRNAESGEQSYSERQIFYSALGRLAREVAAVERTSEEDAQKKLESVLITRRREVAANDEAAKTKEADEKAA